MMPLAPAVTAMTELLLLPGWETGVQKLQKES